MIKTENLCFAYDEEDGCKAILKNINLNIEKGSFTAILGRNGSGKSSLAKANAASTDTRSIIAVVISVKMSVLTK